MAFPLVRQFVSSHAGAFFVSLFVMINRDMITHLPFMHPPI